MKVAILGAGLSGLSCAIGLERYGIKPLVFEKRAHVGEALDYSIILPRVINRPTTDPLKYMRKEYGLNLTPLNHIKKIVIHSPNRRSVERGSLGYIFKRGCHNYALEKQLLDYVNCPITFNKYLEVEDIKDEFDYVVVATASVMDSKKYGVYTDTFNALVKIATIVGEFKPSEVVMWMDRKYSKNGFCYLIPHNEKEASLVLIVNGITSYELDYYWKEFLFTEDIRYAISFTTDTEHDCGFVDPRQVENIIFVGNSAGFTDDLIGCGALNAIESGMLAARAIAKNEDYNALSRPIYEDIKKLHEFRKALNTMGNSKINLMVGFLGLPIVKNIMYNNPFFKISNFYHGAKLYNSFVKNKRRTVE